MSKYWYGNRYSTDEGRTWISTAGGEDWTPATGDWRYLLSNPQTRKEPEPISLAPTLERVAAIASTTGVALANIISPPPTSFKQQVADALGREQVARQGAPVAQAGTPNQPNTGAPNVSLLDQLKAYGVSLSQNPMLGQIGVPLGAAGLGALAGYAVGRSSGKKKHTGGKKKKHTGGKKGKKHKKAGKKKLKFGSKAWRKKYQNKKKKHKKGKKGK